MVGSAVQGLFGEREKETSVGRGRQAGKFDGSWVEVGVGVVARARQPFGRDREKAGQGSPAFKIRHPSFEGEQGHKSDVAAARILGNGIGITCPDTVPFAVWAAARYRGNYREAVAATASVGGDIDTNCAIVGGIVALSVGWEGIPAEWPRVIEPLPFPRA